MKSTRVTAILTVLPLLQLGLPATANSVNLPVIHALPQSHIVQYKPLSFTAIPASNSHVNSTSAPTSHNHAQQQQTSLHQQFINSTPTSANIGTTSAFVTHTAQTSAQSQLLNLDLSSSAANISPSFINKGSITIHVGKADLVITPGMLLTPAEAAAAYSVLTTGHQGLILNEKGIATGGSMVISAKLSSDVDGLDIPKGVMVIDQLSGKAALDLTNGLSNSGHLYLDPLGSAKSSLTILSDNIVNNAGAVIGVDPHESNAAKSFDTLTLDSTGAFSNAGTISSSGSLEIAANNISNFGHISAVQNISEQNISGNSLTVGGSGQTTAGRNFSISVQSIDGTNNDKGQAALTVTDGTYAGKQINFSVPDGSLNVNAHELTGGLNILAGTSNLVTHAGNVDVLTLNVKGDPYMAGPGSFSISGGTMKNLTVIAGGDITLTPGQSSVIDTTQSGETGIIDLEAGVDSVLTNNSTTGGNIVLAGLSALTNGANVILATTAGTTGWAHPGTITFGNITTSSNNAATPDAGSITVSAASTTTVGSITAVGFNNQLTPGAVGGNGGNVTINVKSGDLTITGAINVSGGNGGLGLPGLGGVGGDGGNGGNGVTGTSGIGGPGVGGQPGTGGQSGLGIPAGTGNPGTNGVGGAVSPGKDGGNGGDGFNGTNGFDGGSAGSITLKAPGVIQIKAIIANGGNGGTGGVAGQGGTGGSAGGGGGYDSQTEGDDGARGGDGGDGGKGGNGGTISITAGTSFSTTGSITANGGSGGTGGIGGFGGWGGSGGLGGYGGLGSTGQGNAGQGSKGGDGGSGGDGGDGGSGGDGGDGGKGGDAGDGGQLTINSGTSAVLQSINLSPGRGGMGGEAGGGGYGGYANNGGQGNSGGAGGPGGISYLDEGPTAQNNEKYQATSYYGGMGGAGGAGGDGGKGGDGGGAGDGGDGGAGGAGGHLFIDVGTTFSGTTLTLAGGLINTGGAGGGTFAGGTGNGGGSGGNPGNGGLAGAQGQSGLYTNPPANFGDAVITTINQPGPAPTAGDTGKGGNGGNGGMSGDGGNGGDGGMGGVGGLIIVTHGKVGFTQSGGAPIGPSLNGGGAAGSISPDNLGIGGLAGYNGGKPGLKGVIGQDGAPGATSLLPNTNGRVILENGATISFGGKAVTNPAPVKHTPASKLPPYAAKWFSQSSTTSNATMVAANVHAFDAAAITPSTNAPEFNFRSLFGNSPAASNPQSTSSPSLATRESSMAFSEPIKNKSSIFAPTLLVQHFDAADSNASGLSLTSNLQSNPANNAAELFGTMFGGTSPVQIGLAENAAVPSSELQLSKDGEVPAMLTYNDRRSAHPDYLTGSVEKTDSTSIPNSTDLIEGNYLYSGFDGKLDTPLGQLSVDKDAVVFVSYQASRLAVYNLSSGHRFSVIFRQSNNQIMPIAVGRQFMVSENKAASFDDLNPCKEIPTRFVHERANDHLKIYEAEFSIAHALVNISHLRQKLHSANADDAKVVNRLLKTAALFALMNPPNSSTH